MAAPRAERRLAAILAADVVGYSRLVERDEAGTLERLKGHRKELVEPLLAEHRGRIVKLMGDGALCEFASVVDAVACAVAIQHGMAEREAGAPEDQRIRFRIGINLGDVIFEEGDIFGDGVNIAARLEGLAEPGGVLISGTAFDQVEGKLPLALAFAGEQRVKNIERSVRTYRVDLVGSPKARRIATTRARRPLALAIAAAVLIAVLAAGGAWWYQGRSLVAPPAPDAAQLLEPLPANEASLAVLPFASPSGGDAREGRLADGIAEDLIAELGRYRNIAVIAKSSSFTYKGKAVDARQVGRELGVRYVLEGRLETDPERVRVAVQLIDTGTGAQVWSERYDRPLGEVFAVRDELVQQIAGTLLGVGGPVWGDAVERARRKPPQNLDAYDYVQLASSGAFRINKEGLAEARALLEKAIALDPSYPRAYYQLAWAHFLDALNGYSDDPARSLEQFHAAAEKMVALDPMDPYAQVIAGLSCFKRGDRARGEGAWERALALAPNDPGILRIVGINMAYALGTERAAEGVELIKRARRLNPLMPAWQLNSLGIASYFAGDYEQAIEALEKSGEPSLEHKVLKALTYAQLGRKADAAREVEAILKEKPDFTARGWIANDIMEPGGSSEALFLDGARKAGLPIDRPAPTN